MPCGTGCPFGQGVCDGKGNCVDASPWPCVDEQRCTRNIECYLAPGCEDGECVCQKGKCVKGPINEECKIEEGINYAGNNIPGKTRIKVSSQEECATLCGQESRCKFWTYCTSSKKCDLKTSNSGRKPNKWKVSGNKACAEIDECVGKSCGTICSGGVCDGRGSCVSAWLNPCSKQGCDGLKCGDQCLYQGDISGICDLEGKCE